MPEIGTSGSMSGEGERSDATSAQVTAPFLDSTPGNLGLLENHLFGEPVHARGRLCGIAYLQRSLN